MSTEPDRPFDKLRAPFDKLRAPFDKLRAPFDKLSAPFDKLRAPLPRLDRTRPDVPAAPPVRIVHLGLGNFARAHQAWYTAHARDAADWGIAAFTGRRPNTAEALAPQDGLYTLITRDAEGNRFEIVSSIVEARPAGDHDAYLDHLRRPELAVITITVTEVGYRRRPDGRLDLDDDVVRSDRAAMLADPAAPVTSLPGRLVAGLLARRAAGAGPITLMSCDNLPHNGAVTRTVVTELADGVDATLGAWIEDNVDFAASMVDRITPATTDDDRDLVAREQGYDDAAPVPTEPFSEWVLAGRFPAGRPDWESAGAQVVDDVTPYEQRKLLLLNASHSLLAYAGSIRGHATIDAAIADPACRRWVEELWGEARPHLPLPGEDLQAYCAALLERYANPRNRHQLAQIAPDGSTKLVVRAVPTIVAERAAGRLPVGAATLVAAWLLHLRGQGVAVQDPAADRVRAAAGPDDLTTAAGQVLDVLRSGLGDDTDLVAAVVERAAAIPVSP